MYLREGEEMNQCQKVFEAVMKAKGHTDFSMSGTGKYLNQAMQTRWNYFQLGWEMRGVMI